MYRLLGLVILGLLMIGSLAGCATTEVEVEPMEVEVGPLSITPGDIAAGEAFTVEAGITNIGENDGTFAASIRLDEKVVDKKEVWIAAGATRMVQFDCIAETPGTHTLKLVDSSATFIALKPADFEVTSVSIPTEAYTREAIVIEANVTNIGEVEGIYKARLMVNGTEVGKGITIAPGATETISFTRTIDTPGTYTISLDEATATLTVFLTFPDSNLEAAVRETINKPEGSIYLSDLFPVTTLVAMGRGISDLTGLEYCVNLQALMISDNNISDLSPLASLTNLLTINLDANNISDISPLAGLTNLEELGLVQNNISDLSSLASLTNLRYLDLSENNISDISLLVENSGLSAGDYVDLRKNPFSATSVDVYIPQLIARGVEVIYYYPIVEVLVEHLRKDYPEVAEVVTEQPWFKDGVTDYEALLIRGIRGVARHKDQESANRIIKEEAWIGGEVHLRTGIVTTLITYDDIEEAELSMEMVREGLPIMENFLGPFPYGDLVIHTGDYDLGGRWTEDYIVIGTIIALYHEIAHSYWHAGANWFYEATANTAARHTLRFITSDLEDKFWNYHLPTLKEQLRAEGSLNDEFLAYLRRSWGSEVFELFGEKVRNYANYNQVPIAETLSGTTTELLLADLYVLVGPESMSNAYKELYSKYVNRITPEVLEEIFVKHAPEDIKNDVIGLFKARLWGMKD